MTLGTREEAVLDGRGALLVQLALVALGDGVVAQPQLDVLHGRKRCVQRFHAGGVHGAHLLHDAGRSR